MKEKAETILVVSHAAAERERLATVLRQAGHAVRVASSAAEALDSYGKDPAAVVVADRDLPGADGRARLDQAGVALSRRMPLFSPHGCAGARRRVPGARSKSPAGADRLFPPF